MEPLASPFLELFWHQECVSLLHLPHSHGPWDLLRAEAFGLAKLQLSY